MRSIVRREKRKCQPPLPEIIDTLEFNGPERCLFDGEDWLLIDTYSNLGERIIVFASGQNLARLAQAEWWAGDGTFSRAPQVQRECFQQLYTIHAPVHGALCPLAYCLLCGKSTAIYTTLLKSLMDKIETNRLTLSLQCFFSDLESGMISALKQHFPALRHEVCFFHLSQSIWRKVQDFGLRQRYVSDVEFSIIIKMMAALAFVPVEGVLDTFEELAKIMPKDAADVMSYFREHYIDGRRPRGRPRLQATFPPKLWNCRNRVLQDQPRTTNGVEAWHRRLSSTIGASHPNIWTFMSFIRKEQAKTDVDIARLEIGHPLPKRKKKEVDRDGRIKHIVRNYDSGDKIAFLRAVAHNFEF